MSGDTAESSGNAKQIAVIIPCYQAESGIGSVIDRVGPEVDRIYCIDDASTDGTIAVIMDRCATDSRIVLIGRAVNGGVGAATVTGYRRAIDDGFRVLVKLDADGQMNPTLIPHLVAPILEGKADYVKGNRFFSVENLWQMPLARAWGNAGVSYMAKISSGYWQLFDPTNGFTALHADVAAALPLHKLHHRFFFESDLLFRLNTIGACIREVPMRPVYNGGGSHLSEFASLVTFPALHLRNAIKRMIYNYFLRNFSVASVNLVVGLVLVAAGTSFGVQAWMHSSATGIPATAGTVMLSALPFLVGVQLVLSFLAYDVAMVPSEPVQNNIPLFNELDGRNRAYTK